MSQVLDTSAFASFFRAIHSCEPFKWQVALLERVMREGWPQVLDLPTAAGKTAVMDIWAFALAATTRDLHVQLPRRLWFVVDRRIVVDAAYERALHLETALRDAKEGIVKVVADQLRSIAGIDGLPALKAGRLRGGVLKDDSGLRVPTQPAILSCTVDQIGSRLLFRGYGVSPGTRSIHAALVAYDSLVVLDEAHTAQPFMQTFAKVQDYQRFDPGRHGNWLREPVARPAQLMVMSATPPKTMGLHNHSAAAVFPRTSERDELFADAALQRRLQTPKIARLVKTGKDRLVETAAVEALAMVNGGLRRVAVMVNRVKYAQQIVERLNRLQVQEPVPQVRLLTSLMRPVERDALVDELTPRLKSSEARKPEQPIILVTTQCLEVGADFSFDGLVTQCASLEALRQRFGRLNRIGAWSANESAAAILMDEADDAVAKKLDDAKPKDFVYGNALVRTWHWLLEQASAATDGRKSAGKMNVAPMIDMSVIAVDRLIAGHPDALDGLLPPTQPAAVLMPAHLDVLAQTNPSPQPDVDVSVYLHAEEPELTASVIWRRDIDLRRCNHSIEAREQAESLLSLVPPQSGEALTVPLHKLHRWLKGDSLSSQLDLGDIESPAKADPANRDAPDASLKAIPFAIYRREEVVWNADVDKDVTPGAVVLVQSDEPESQAETDAARLAHFFCRSDTARYALDVVEQALWRRSRALLLRLPLSEEFEEEFTQALDRFARRRHPTLQGLYEQLIDAAESTGAHDNAASVIAHSLGVVTGEQPELLTTSCRFDILPMRTSQLCMVLIQPDDIKDRRRDVDLDEVALNRAAPVTLARHAVDVAQLGSKFARICADPELSSAYEIAGRLHDLGKADGRLQRVRMFAGSEVSAAMAMRRPLAFDGGALAKSGRVVGQGPRQLEDSANLPACFRHEATSLQFAQTRKLDGHRDLILHLIASHHGHGRPFMPAIADSEAPALTLDPNNDDLNLDAQARRESLPHRLGSGVAERFFSLQQRYGWWGLAYLEAIFRLADWQVSAGWPVSAAGTRETQLALPPRTQRLDNAPLPSIDLPGLDGANPLGFLAAAGLLRTLTVMDPQRRYTMAWFTDTTGAWRPRLSGWSMDPFDGDTQCAFAEHVRRCLMDYRVDGPTGPQSPGIASLADKIGVSRDKFSQAIDHAFAAFASATDEFSARMALEKLSFLAAYAFAGDVDAKSGNVNPSMLSFGNGQGGKNLLKDFRATLDGLSAQHIARTLFSAWDYADVDAPALRWDPRELRPYALQEQKPEKLTRLSMRGANALAFMALPLFAVLPRSGGAATTGFIGTSRRFQWPIWTRFISLPTLQAMLAHGNARCELAPPVRLDVGIATIFECERLTRSKSLYFSHASGV